VVQAWPGFRWVELFALREPFAGPLLSIPMKGVSPSIRGRMMKKFAIATVAALGLGLAACDGPQENAAEDTGEQMAEEVNDQAEAMEDAGQITDAQEDAMTDAAEDKADAMEETGEEADQAADDTVVE
jgi:hypothetical protein